jgi:hypothetical protein
VIAAAVSAAVPAAVSAAVPATVSAAAPATVSATVPAALPATISATMVSTAGRATALIAPTVPFSGSLVSPWGVSGPNPAAARATD